MAHDVFVSHSSKDKTTADAVCAVLESQGIRCWVAPRDIIPGTEWGASIVEAIKGARVMVLIFSAHANGSPQINKEVERAINKGIPVIPMRIEDIVPTASLEYFLSSNHWLNAFSPPLEKHLQYLAQVVRQIIGGPAKEVLPIPPAERESESPETAEAGKFAEEKRQLEEQRRLLAAEKQKEDEAAKLAEEKRKTAEAMEKTRRAKEERKAVEPLGAAALKGKIYRGIVVVIAALMAIVFWTPFVWKMRVTIEARHTLLILLPLTCVVSAWPQLKAINYLGHTRPSFWHTVRANLTAMLLGFVFAGVLAGPVSNAIGFYKGPVPDERIHFALVSILFFLGYAVSFWFYLQTPRDVRISYKHSTVVSLIPLVLPIFYYVVVEINALH